MSVLHGGTVSKVENVNARRRELLKKDQKKRDSFSFLKTLYRRPMFYVAAILLATICIYPIRYDFGIKLLSFFAYIHLKPEYSKEDLLGGCSGVPVYGNPKNIIPPPPLDMEVTNSIFDLVVQVGDVGSNLRSTLSTHALLRATPEELNNIPGWPLGVISEMIYSGLEQLVPPSSLNNSVNSFNELNDAVNNCITQSIKFTERDMPIFEKHPNEYDNSVAKFKMAALISYLRRDFGIKYDPKWGVPPEYLDLWDEYMFKKNREIFWQDPERLFLRGVFKKKGTCSSLPVLTVIVGRRMGYPLKLVETKQHLFARWVSTNEVFNIECTSDGVSFHPDEYYRTGRYALTDDEIKNGKYLCSMTHADELAMLCFNRGVCLFHNEYLDESIKWIAKGLELQQLPEQRAAYLKAAQKNRENKARRNLIDKIFREGRMGYDPVTNTYQERWYKCSLTKYYTVIDDKTNSVANTSAFDDTDEKIVRRLGDKYGHVKLPKGAIYAP